MFPTASPTGRSRGIIPVTVLASTDPVLRDAALAGLLLDAPGVVAVRHDLHPDHLHRVVQDAGGVVEDVLVPLEHACLSCAVREDAVPTVARLAHDPRWTHVVLALPVSAEPLPAARALAAGAVPGGVLAHTRVATTVALVDLDTAEHDLLGDEVLLDRGLGLTPHDPRSVGEALATQLEQSDLVVTCGEGSGSTSGFWDGRPSGSTSGSGLAAGAASRRGATAGDPTASGLVDRLRGAGTRRVDGLHALTAADLVVGWHSAAVAERRAHPLGASVAAPDPVAGDRSWTLALSSPLPFHPQRLLDEIEDLGTGRLRSRGVFHVADRPGLACLWDGAGGQLAVADLGPWGEVCAGTEPQTRIVVVGRCEPDGSDGGRRRVREAFERALCTPAEAADGVEWLWGADFLAPWLGAR